MFAELSRAWGTLDFLVHAVAFSDKAQLTGRYADTTRENFIRTMVISCFSFTEAAKRAAALMPNGGAMLTLTYNGGLRAMPNYNAMGLAKAALEASVRYLAVDFGTSAIRVNAISAGPIRTLAGAGIGDARAMFAFQQRHSPLHRGVTLDDLGGAGLYLLSDLSTGVTGEIHFVDSGYNVIAMPHPDALRADQQRPPDERAFGAPTCRVYPHRTYVQVGSRLVAASPESINTILRINSEPICNGSGYDSGLLAALGPGMTVTASPDAASPRR